MDIGTLALRDFQALLAVAEHRHFGRSARACHISQPALSAQVKKVESVLGFPVFERTPRRVRLTARGEAAIAQVQRVMDEAQRLERLGGHAHSPLDGRLRLGAIPTVGPHLLPHLLAPLRAAHPRLELHIYEGVTRDLLTRLHAGEIDAALVSPPVTGRGMTVEPLYTERLLLAVPVNHPLAARRRVRVEEVMHGELLLLADGHCLRDQALQLCALARREIDDARLQSTSLTTLLHLVAAGVGTALLPQLAVPQSPPLTDLIRCIPFVSRVATRRVALVWRRGAPDAEDAPALAQFIRTHLPPSVQGKKSGG